MTKSRCALLAAATPARTLRAGLPGGPALAHATAARSGYGFHLLLIAILLLGAVPRFWRLADPALGVVPDEALNAWSTQCLLRTGRDPSGAPWPVFYTYAMSDNRSTLMLYLGLPFQALGGFNITTMRLPALAAGLGLIVAVAYAGWRLFDAQTGLLAAAAAALSPWAVVLSRIGHEGALVPFQAGLVFAAMVWLGYPRATPSLAAGLAVGLLAGVQTYGYPALRPVVPLLLLGLALVAGSSYWRDRKNWRGAAGVAVGYVALFGPLLDQHLRHPEQISRRADVLALWEPDDPLMRRVQLVAERYALHYSPWFLFAQGDTNEVWWPAAYGVFPPAAAPLMLAGAAVLIWRARRCAAARALLVFLVVYPAGDVVHQHSNLSVHVYRAAPGLAALALTAGVGAASLSGWMRRRAPALHLTAASTLGLLAMLYLVDFTSYLLGQRQRQAGVYHGSHTDLVLAVDWLRTRWEDYDAVYITRNRMMMAYLPTLVALRYDPSRWFTEPREYHSYGYWEDCFRFGRFHFGLPQEALRRPAEQRWLAVARPFEPVPGEVLHEVRDTLGDVMLRIVQVR